MKNIHKVLVIGLITFGFTCFYQNLQSSENENNEAMISYTAIIRFSGNEIIQEDTLLVRNSLVLEPIKEDIEQLETDLLNDRIKTRSTSKRLRWYCITDVSKMIGMRFDAKKEPTAKNIKTFTSKSKNFGYGMTVEPFLLKNGYSISDFSKVGDTVLNGQMCAIILANRKIPVLNNGMKDELLYTRIIINPQIKGQNYSFISDILARHFGGAIVFAQSSYKSGVILSMNLEYKTELSALYSAIFDKYQAFYLSNIKLLTK